MYSKMLSELEHAPEGPNVLALFDLDRTLVSGYSVSAFAFERLPELAPRTAARTAASFLAFGLGRIDYHGLLSEIVRDLEGVSEKEMRELARRAFDKRLAGRTYREAYDVVQAHMRKRHRVVIVSSATRYQVELVARELSIAHIACTELEVASGRLTGRVLQPACYGDGKRIAAERMAAHWGVSLDDAYFYTDSDEDLPLLEVVGNPRCVNAKPALAIAASERGWPQVRFTRPVKPSVGQRIRARLALP